MMPYSEIKLGDVFMSGLYGSTLSYMVDDKKDGLVKVVPVSVGSPKDTTDA